MFRKLQHKLNRGVKAWEKKQISYMVCTFMWFLLFWLIVEIIVFSYTVWCMVAIEVIKNLYTK